MIPAACSGDEGHRIQLRDRSANMVLLRGVPPPFHLRFMLCRYGFISRLSRGLSPEFIVSVLNTVHLCEYPSALDTGNRPEHPEILWSCFMIVCLKPSDLT